MGSLLVLALALLSEEVYGPTGAWALARDVVALLLLAAAAAGRVWAGIYICGRKASELVCAGPYARVRNPLYLSSFVGAIGVGLAFDSLTLTALLGGLFLFTHWPAVEEEERWLGATFGREFESYCSAVPRVVPRLRGAPGPVHRWGARVDRRRLARCVGEAALILCAFPLAQAVAWAHASGALACLVRLP